MSQPATAGIVVGCIFIGIGATYFGFKLYQKLWHIRQQRALERAGIEAGLPPIRSTAAAPAYSSASLLGLPPLPGGAASPGGTPPAGGSAGYATPGGLSTPGSTLASPYATLKKMSYDAGGSFDTDRGAGGVNKSLPFAPSFERSRNGSFAGTGTPLAGSAPGSPISPGSALPGLDASEFGHARSLNGSTSTTAALQRSYTPSLYKLGASSAHLQYASSGSSNGGRDGSGGAGTPSPGGGLLIPARRESYLPHNPANRESMMIIPPQPLGFGTPNSMAMGTDQKTLAFSKASGVGAHADEFGNAFTWIASASEGGAGAGAEEESLADDVASGSGSGSGSGIGPRRGSSSKTPAALERERYLRRGPTSMLGVSGVDASSSSAGVSRTSSPASTSASPHVPRGDSRASQRSAQSPGERPARESPQYPPSAATFKGLHQFAQHNRSNSSGVGGAHPSHHHQHQHASALSQSDSMGTYSADHATADGSPIMGPFRVPARDSSPSPRGGRKSAAAGAAGHGAFGGDPLSASASAVGSSTDSAAGDVSTPPTTTGGSERQSRSSGSMRSDASKSGAQRQEQEQQPKRYFAYGAGLVSQAGQKLRAAAGAQA